MAQLGYLNQVYSEAGIYTKSELTDYLMTLSQEISAVAGSDNTRIAMELCNSAHSISMVYMPDSQAWVCMDINNWPPKTFDSSCVSELSQYLNVLK